VYRIFILSPANSAGERANLIYNPAARFGLARRLQQGEKVPLAEIFSFLSGLYFRGKYTYASKFARPPGKFPGVHVITSNRGLLPVDHPTSLAELRAFASTPIDPKEPAYVEPLNRSARRAAKTIGRNCEIVLLGSIGTGKYADILVEHFQEQLLFPTSFVGRGDMSRGGLLLRSVAESQELEYAPISGSTRHGKRPEKLPPKRWGYKIMEGKTVIGQPMKKG
jgi:hypothetical protein